MANEPTGTCYPFYEKFTGTTSTTTGVTIGTIQAKTVVIGVMARIKTAGVGTGNVAVGDEDTSNGFITAFDATGTAGTVYGDTPSERGAFLYDGTVRGSYWKLYPAAKAIKLTGSAATLTTEAIIDVYIWGFTYD